VIVMCGLRRKKNGRFDQKDDNLLNGLLVDDKRQIRRAESFTMNGKRVRPGWRGGKKKLSGLRRNYQLNRVDEVESISGLSSASPN
jgi:hypothetical protein